MSYSDSSQLLNKQAELKLLQAKYETYAASYSPIAAATITTPNKNAISTTNPPPGVRPGEDFNEYWKFISSGATTPAGCWTSATRDPRVFQKVVYTGDTTSTNNGDAAWNKKCYGLTWDAPTEASYNTDAPGYSTMVSDVGFANKKYTKTGITSMDALNEATQMSDLKTRMDSLIEEIALIATSSINSELDELSKTSSDKSAVIQKINQYMNSSTTDIDSKYKTIELRKNMNNVYEDVNKQITLNSRKYKFVFYFFIGIIIILSYISYVSKLTIIEQVSALTNWVTWGWWANWGIITFVVVLLILSSFGWDMRGNIMMLWRYLSDPSFWTGQMWWIGVTFLFLIVIFAYTTFKSFFAPVMAVLEKVDTQVSGDDE